MASITFVMQPQQKTLWCWAAVTSSVDAFFPATQQTEGQCGVVNLVMGFTDCCNAPTPAACNVESGLTTALIAVNNASGLPKPPLTYAVIETELLAGRPVCVRIERPGGGSHFMVIIKCSTGLFGKQFVDLADSASGGMTHLKVNLAKFASPGIPGVGRWVNTYKTRP